jgi:hypothetical protein
MRAQKLRKALVFRLPSKRTSEWSGKGGGGEGEREEEEEEEEKEFT